MWIAFIPVVLWSFNALCTTQAARRFGALGANRWRLLMATAILGVWTSLGPGWPSHAGAWGWLLLSGAAGLGVGDLGMLAAYRRIGPRVTALMIACLAVPVTAAVEWVWLDTALTAREIALCGGILCGVALVIAPGARIPAPDRRSLFVGLLHGLLAAGGQGMGVALSRAAYRAAAADGEAAHGVSAAAIRMLGGLGCTLLAELMGAATAGRNSLSPLSRKRWWEEGKWLAAAALLGPILGVSAYQWALIYAPGALVQSVVALVPVFVMLLTWRLEGDRPGWRGLAGGVIACGCAIALALGTKN